MNRTLAVVIALLMTTVSLAGCIGGGNGDDDGDEVMNDVDLCPLTPTGETVDANGCSQTQLDDDGDGVMNDVDLCPSTPTATNVDSSGCEPTFTEIITDVSNVTGSVSYTHLTLPTTPYV